MFIKYFHTSRKVYSPKWNWGVGGHNVEVTEGPLGIGKKRVMGIRK
jgi:hypothetical protein